MQTILILISISCLVTATGAAALDNPNQTSYTRTRFTTENGLRSDVVNEIVQSNEGFLWMRLGGLTVMRFDGHHLLGIPQLAYALSMALAPNGDLWIGTSTDLKRVPASDLKQLDMGHAVTSFPLGRGYGAELLRFTRDGTLWVGTSHGLYRFNNGKFLQVITGPSIERIEEEVNGRLWITVREGPPIEWDGNHALVHTEFAGLLGVKQTEIFHVFEDRHGMTWFCTKNGIARRVGGKVEKLEPYGPLGHAAYRVYEDPKGRIWFAREEGLAQLTPAGLELVAPGMKVRRMYGDQDGNLWVGTNGDGLYRIRESAVRTFTTADGLPSNTVMSVLRSYDGSLWAGFNCGGIAHFDGHRFRIFDQKDGLSNVCVWTLAEDQHHDLWIGTWGGGLFQLHEGKFTQYSKAQGLDGDIVRSVATARDGSVWLAGADGVSHLRLGQIRNYTASDGLSGQSYRLVFEDHAGRIWAVSERGTDQLVGERFVPFSVPNQGTVKLIGEDATGSLYFATLQYQTRPTVFRLIGNQTTLVRADELDPEMSEAPQADLPVRPKFQALDLETFELPEIPATEVTSGHPASAIAPDGKCWIATSEGLKLLDLERIQRTTRQPLIYVEKITVGRNQQPSSSELVLPSGSNHLEVDFDAVDISAPEKIRLQYRLDGVDSEWLDATPPGHAVYSMLPPGKHAFHMRACNRSGIWDRTGIVYFITQEPYFYQTGWFIAACIGFGLLLLAVLYRAHVHQAVARANLRTEERFSERMRIARELHDTLLQSFHGLMFQFQAVRNLLPGRVDEAMHSLDDAIDETEKALAESRGAIQDLRAEPIARVDPAETLMAESKQLSDAAVADHVVPDFDLVEEGERRPLSAAANDEVCRIAIELLRNAFHHAGASRIEAEIRYDDQLFRMRIRDNGIGIDPQVLKDGGRSGHWGLRGIRERAERIGATLDFWSEAGAGTEAEITVPGAIAYQRSSNGVGRKLLHRIGIRA